MASTPDLRDWPSSIKLKLKKNDGVIEDEDQGQIALAPNSAGSDENIDSLSGLTLLDSIMAAPVQVKRESSILTYSDYLVSRIVSVVVEQKTYHLHSSLLCQQSKKLKKTLTSPFREEQDLMIHLPEETSGLFSEFIDFHYIPDWKPACESSDDLVYLSEIYAMGERLLANKFQASVLRVFHEKLTTWTLETSQFCRLLTVACSNITERPYPDDDPMRQCVFWLAASKITRLQAYEEFQALLITEADLGRQLALRAGNGANAQPSKDLLQNQLRKQRRK